MKKIFKIIAVISVVLLVGSVVLHKQCDKTLIPVEPDNEFKLPVEIYHPPIVKIPFKTVRMPIDAKKLPIRSRDVAKTIEVGKNAVIVIDKKGNIYTTRDTPRDIPIKVTVWKRKALAFESKWGATLAMNPGVYLCISWSFLRVWKIHAGVDAGISPNVFNRSFTKDDFLIGIAMRYKVLPKNNIFISAGWAFTHKTIYVGVTINF